MGMARSVTPVPAQLADPTPKDELPLVDEHDVVVDADAERVWTAMSETLDAAFTGPLADAYASLVGCAPSRASGARPLEVGSTIDGFGVVTAWAPARMELRGRHRFSEYALTLRLEPIERRKTRVRAETRAAFPGIGGRLYRLAVIGTGGHAVTMRRLLARISRNAARGS